MKTNYHQNSAYRENCVKHIQRSKSEAFKKTKDSYPSRPPVLAEKKKTVLLWKWTERVCLCCVGPSTPSTLDIIDVLHCSDHDAVDKCISSTRT